MPEKTEPKIAESDSEMEEYFSTQFGPDKNILTGVMGLSRQPGGNLKWEDLSDIQKAALNRLATRKEEETRRGFLGEGEAEFLCKIMTR